MYVDNAFFMICDMVTEKAEEYILLPYLNLLFGSKHDKYDGEDDNLLNLL
ncbi:hypothetical protein LQZ18_10980 [Lachnospiraceae bacterium ZAX-1]